MPQFWRVPPIFAGETVAVIATGPSLSQEHADMVHAAGIPAVAVNNGYEYAPWASILYACDAKWWANYWERGARGPGAKDFAGLRVSLEETPYKEILRVGNGGPYGFDERRDHVRTGKNSGCQAAHIAAHGGARRIILLGCDCRVSDDGKTHSFGEHAFRQRKSPATTPYNEFLKGWHELGRELEMRGVEIVNCSPVSAIESFRKMDLTAALRKLC